MATAVDSSKNVSSSKEILKQLNSFVRGASDPNTNINIDLANSALYLLQSLPASRQAVLQYLSNLFDEAVATYIQRVTLFGDSNSQVHENVSTEVVIEQVHDALLRTVRSNPRGWGPIIAAWCLSLLGEISVKYSARYLERRTNPGAGAASLNELLQLWMTCTATKTLIEIASESFASMVSTAPDICVNDLLEASVKYSPHFDWVVAHIGSCFPQTIITRVLECGLRDYSDQGGGAMGGASSSGGGARLPKMASVVGILGHLAGQHTRIIRAALLDMFHKCLSLDASPAQSYGIQFLLHLASLSPMLHTACTLEFVAGFSVPMLNKIGLALSKRNIPEQEVERLMGLVIHLVSSSQEAAFQMLNILLDTAYPAASRQEVAMETGSSEGGREEQVDERVRRVCCITLQQLTIHLQKASHSTGAGGEGGHRMGVPFISGLQPHARDICTMLVKETNTHRQEVLSGMVLCLAVSGSEAQAAQVLAHLVTMATTQQPLSLFVRVVRETELRHTGICGSGVQQVLSSLQQPSQLGGEQGNAYTTLKNLRAILQWEKQQQRRPLREYLQASMESVASLIYHCQDDRTTAMALEVLAATGFPPQLPVAAITRLAAVMVDALFHALQVKDASLKVSMCGTIRDFLEELTCYPAAQKNVLRIMLEGALEKPTGVVLGGKMPESSTNPPIADVPRPQLFSAHQASELGDSQLNTVAFHGGIIGRGLKPLPRPSPFSQAEQFENQQMFMEVLTLCSCHRNTLTTTTAAERERAASSREEKKLSSHIAKFLALQVIELVTPDVMYNGIPWPEEDFAKITVERDLLVKKKFENNPVLWSIMEFVASGPGAMCYCSVILRSVMATLLNHWERSRDMAARNSPWQLHASVRIVQYMKMGDLLPPPLSYTGEVLDALTPYEVYLLLLNLWKYMKENPPVPEPKDWNAVGCDPRYTEVIRSILHANIGSLGHLYPRFFSVKT